MVPLAMPPEDTVLVPPADITALIAVPPEDTTPLPPEIVEPMTVEPDETVIFVGIGSSLSTTRF
jgi:hypothetical protein